LMIISAVPLSAIGGILALYSRGLPFSISAAIGFIALFGVAVLNGLVLVGYLNQIREEGAGDSDNLRDLVMEGCVDRLRPVLMTALVGALGFLPMVLSTSAGAEVQQPLATVVVGGLITSTLLTLLVLPALYLLFERKNPRSGARSFAAVPGSSFGVVLLLFVCLSGIIISTTACAQPPSDPLAKQSNRLSVAEWRQERDLWVERSLRGHPRLEEAELAVRGAETRLSQWWYPGKTQINWDRGQINYALIDRNISIIQPLGSPFAVGAGMRYGRLEVRLAEARLEETRLQLVHEIRDAYSAAAYYRERLRLLEMHTWMWRQADSVMLMRTEVGSSDRLSALLSRQQLDALDWQLTRAQLELDQALRALGKVCHLDTLPSPPGWPFGEIPAPGVARPHPISRVWSAKRALDLQVENLQKSALGPEISVGAFNQTLEQVAGFRGIIVQVSVPLIPLRAGASVEAARLLRLQNDLKLDREELSMGHEQRQARQEFVMYSDRVRKQFTEVGPRLNELQEQARYMLIQGSINYFEYAQTMESVHQSRLDNLYNEYQLHRAAHRLAALTYVDNP